jgi:hypothetical protein
VQQYTISAGLGGANVTYFEEICRLSVYYPLHDVTWFCNLFPGYYTWQSLRDFTRNPNPWREMTTMANAVNAEWQYGRAGLGCLGVS